ncbi:MAG: hypothetical protein IRZ27_05955 [Acidothermus cellulolyticus]|nr:hypothetical protein [Acidothermus cellulolyticus]MCL6551286.1 hypothetical protein [Acidothermus cellulolyticus]
MARFSSARPLQPWQFWAGIIILVVCGALALLALAGTVGAHGSCPNPGQDSRPANANCFPPYQHQEQTGVVG